MDVQDIEINKISTNELNPRHAINEEGLEELAESIRTAGVLQPILVRPKGKGFEIVAGERRFKACKMVGLRTIPAVVREMSDDEVIETMLIENAQREELNDVEKGNSCLRLKQLYPEKYPNDRSLADRLGVTVSSVRMWIRVASDVPAEIQELIATQEKRGDPVPKGTITSQVALQITKTADEPKRQIEIAREFAEKTIPVHKARKVIRELKKSPEEPVEEIVQRVLEAPPELPFRFGHSIAVANGVKTQTSRFFRRDEEETLEPGVLVKANIWEPSFATLEVTEVIRKRLGEFTEEDAQREGGYTLDEFKRVWESIHGSGSWKPSTEVVVVRFKVDELKSDPR